MDSMASQSETLVICIAYSISDVIHFILHFHNHDKIVTVQNCARTIEVILW